MAKHRGKKYLEIAKLVETGKLYEVKEALDLVLKTRTAKFTETVEVALRLGVDPRHADQQVRGTVVLPHGTGKTVKVLAITSGANIEKALAAGADYAGAEEYINQIQQGVRTFRSDNAVGKRQGHGGHGEQEDSCCGVLRQHPHLQDILRGQVVPVHNAYKRYYRSGSCR